MSPDDWDEMNFPRPETQGFDAVVEAAISRRGFMGGTLAFGSGAAVMGTSILSGEAAMAGQADRFAFDQLPIQTDGTVHVPEGYTWDVLVRWGDPLFSDAPAFDAEMGVQRWSREFGPVVKVDRLMRKTIQDEEAKESFC